MANQNQSFQSSVFQLGKVAFTVLNCDENYVADLDRLFPRCAENDMSNLNIINVQSECNKDILNLANYVASRHRSCVALAGSIIVSPTGAKVLLVGRPRSGRTTLSMQLVLEQGWKIFTDELVLLEHDSGVLIPFAAPFRYDENTAQLLGSHAPSDYVRSTWIGAKPLNVGVADGGVYSEMDPRFDFCFWLDQPVEDETKTSVTEAMPGAILTKILPLSNLLRAKNASDIIFAALQSASCYQVSGSFSDRLQVVIKTTCSS